MTLQADAAQIPDEGAQGTRVAPPPRERRRDLLLRRYERAALLATVGVALLLRLSSAKMQADLWYDEAYSLRVASRPFGEMMRLLHVGGDTNPPLYTILLHFWLMLGNSDFFVKFLSLLFGTGCLWMLHRIGRRTAGLLAGLVAALLFAVSEWGIYYSIEARPYALLFFLALASTDQLLLVLKAGGFGHTAARTHAALYLAATVLAAWTHWFGLLLVPVHVAGLAIYRVSRRGWLGYAKALSILALLLIPLGTFLWNQFGVQQAVGGFNWPGAPDLPYVLEYLQYLAGGETLLLVAAGVLLTAALRRRKSEQRRSPTRKSRADGVLSARRHVLFLACYALLPVAIVYAVSSVSEEFSFFVFRYFLAFGLGALVLLGIAIVKLPQWLALVAVVVLAGMPIQKILDERDDPQKPYSRVTRESWPGEGRRALRLHLSPMSYHSVLRYRRPGSHVEDRILWDSRQGMSYVLDYNLRGEMIHPEHLVDFREGLHVYDEFWLVFDEIYPSRRALAIWESLKGARGLERVSSAQFATVRLERYRTRERR